MSTLYLSRSLARSLQGLAFLRPASAERNHEYTPQPGIFSGNDIPSLTPYSTRSPRLAAGLFLPHTRITLNQLGGGERAVPDRFSPTLLPVFGVAERDKANKICKLRACVPPAEKVATPRVFSLALSSLREQSWLFHVTRSTMDFKRSFGLVHSLLRFFSPTLDEVVQLGRGRLGRN